MKGIPESRQAAIFRRFYREEVHFFILPEEELSAELERGLRGELARDYGILVFIFVFSMINLANTLITNLLTRQQELGLFGTLTYHFPALQVLLFGAALLLVQGVFSVCAVRCTRRRSLVDRIKNDL